MWVKEFVQWYNHDHRHSRIKFVTPQQRHTGEDVQLLEKRHALYSRMIKMHPERWSTTTRNWQHEPTVELNPKHDKERPHEPFRRLLCCQTPVMSEDARLVFRAKFAINNQHYRSN